MGLPNETKALVTGAGGFIGARMCARLLADGQTVIGIDNGRSADFSRLRPAVDLREHDISAMTVGQWRDILDGVEVVYHLAAEKYNSSKSTPTQVIDTNITGTYVLARAAADAGVRKIVFTSSLYAYGSMGPDPMSETDVPTPSTMYGMSKLAGESILATLQREAGLSYAVARLFFVYGPHQWAEGGYKSVVVTTFERILRGEAPVVNGSGEQQLDYLWIDDAVAALQQLAEPRYDGLVVNVASGRGTAVNELIEMMCEVTGYTGAIEAAPPDWTEGSRRIGNTGRLESELGWIPERKMIEGLRDVWASMSKGRQQ